MITLDQLRTIMPFAGPRAAVYLDPLNSAMGEFGIDTPARAGMFLANLAHESGSLRWTREIASGTAYDKRKDLGNTKPDAIVIAGQHGSTPGPWWRGGGFGQITGYNNYRQLSADLYGDPELLLHHPELLEQPLDACRSAGWFWWRHGLAKFADAGDFDGVCDLWNKGHKTTTIGDANGYDDRASAWSRAQKVLR